MARQWAAGDVLELSRSFQGACVLMAAAELDVFTVLAGRAMTAAELAGAIAGDERATAVLADALTAMGLLTKQGGRYRPAAGTEQALGEGAAGSSLAMVRHQANCMRGWAQLARVVRTGKPADRPASVRGEAGDLAAFIEAMEVASRQAAEPLVEAIGPPEFEHLLDVGGGPATWTIAFLRARPQARATLYDRPAAIPIARRHIRQAGLADRVKLVAGDFYRDDRLPGGADLAWVSAIIHQNSRPQNRELFAKVREALVDGGRVLIRDVVMDEGRVSPPAGALFAINMLVNTAGGGTYTFEEIREDLAAAGFGEATLLHRDAGMNSVVQGRLTR